MHGVMDPSRDYFPVSKGQWLIVIHAGGEQGFIPNAYVRFKTHQWIIEMHISGVDNKTTWKNLTQFDGKKKM
jgi:hypothetical protein